MVLWLATAWADTFEVPADYGSLTAAVAEARRRGGTHQIHFAAGFNAADEVPQDVSDLILTIDANGGLLPALQGSDVALTVIDGTFSWGEGYTWTSFGTLQCAVCIERGALTLDSVEFSGVEGYGVIGADANLTFTGVVSRSGWSGRSVFAFTESASPAVSIVDSQFYDAGSGTLKFYGVGAKKVNVELTDVTISGSTGSEGAAIYAVGTELVMTGGTITGSSASNADQAAPINANNSQLTFTGVDLALNYGSASALLYSEDDAGAGVSILGGRVFGNSSSSGLELEGEMLTLDEVDWTPSGSAFGHFQLDVFGSKVRLTKPPAEVLRTDDGTVTVTRTRFCGGDGRTAFSLAAVGKGDLYFVENVVAEAVTYGLPWFTFSGVGASTVYVVDNDFLSAAAGAYFSGSVRSLYVINNIDDTGTEVLGLDTVPAAVVAGHNLFQSEFTSFYVDLPEVERNDVYGDAGIASDYAVGCDTWPELAAGSPAIDAGDPRITALDGMSDIGARDFGGNVEEPDTGIDTCDTGVTTDTGDTGVTTDTADTGDSSEPGGSDADGDGFPADVDCDDLDGSIFPGAEDLPGDDVDQDCDGATADIAYAGGCGCDAGGVPSAAMATLIALAALRRARSG